MNFMVIRVHLLSLRMLAGCISVVEYVSTSLYFIDIPPSVHSLVHGHLGCSNFLAVRSNVALTAFVSSCFHFSWVSIWE